MALSAAGNARRGGKGVVMAMGLRPSDQPEALTEAMDNGEEQGGDSGSRSGSRPHRGFLLPGPGHDDAEWEPPSEAELKVIQARRERQDKISKLMSEYLLKGYRMLGECCDECGTILLQDKQKKLYCVTCQELNSDVDKDNPALNAQAALSQVRERQLATNTDEMVSRPEHCEGAALGLRSSAPDPALPASTTAPNALLARNTLAAAEETILQKIGWASQHLQETTSVERSIQLCSLIRSCTDALKGIRELPQ